jgi:hypothetical protein
LRRLAEQSRQPQWCSRSCIDLMLLDVADSFAPAC